MPLSAWPWAFGAAASLAGGVMTLRRGRGEAQPLRTAGLIMLGLALLAVVAGLAWRAGGALAWPGASPADALALLAGGGLAVTAWLMLAGRADKLPAARDTASGLALLGTAALLGVAAALAPAWPATSLESPAGAWLFGLRSLLAGVGLGGWLPALAASVRWFIRIPAGRAPAEPAAEADASPGAEASPLPMRPETAQPGEDPGRIAAAFSFPWLTAACLAGGAWNLIAYAAPGRAAPAELWLLAAWLLGGSYLHITSSWRPLRLPGWLSPLIAAGVVAAGVLAASTAESLR